MRCVTGSCGNREQCNGAGGEPPATLAEFNFKGDGGKDFYDVSLVDGYNIPVLIDAKGGWGDCKRAGGCHRDINQICPQHLAVKHYGRTVACKSSCVVYNNDRECCRGAFGNPATCLTTQTAKLFKDSCPTAYSFAHDDKDATTYTCIGANYVVQFC